MDSVLYSTYFTCFGLLSPNRLQISRTWVLFCSCLHLWVSMLPEIEPTEWLWGNIMKIEISLASWTVGNFIELRRPAGIPRVDKASVPSHLREIRIHNTSSRVNPSPLCYQDFSLSLLLVTTPFFPDSANGVISTRTCQFLNDWGNTQ